ADTVVCGFTDSRGLWVSGNNLSGYAVSFDHGATWSDRGAVPNAYAPAIVFGEPTVLTDGAGYWFYLSELDRGNGSGGPGTGDLSVVLQRGHFVGTSLVWSAPWVVAGGPAVRLDSAHMAIDPARNHIYVTYTNITHINGQIEVVTVDLVAMFVLN